MMFKRNDAKADHAAITCATPGKGQSDAEAIAAAMWSFSVEDTDGWRDGQEWRAEMNWR